MSVVGVVGVVGMLCHGIGVAGDKMVYNNRGANQDDCTEGDRHKDKGVVGTCHNGN